jgi:nucleoside-diphosphate-sugar epimerase
VPGNTDLSDIIAVTGATGFIGKAICRELLKNGLRVTALLRTPSVVSAELSAAGVQFVNGDLDNEAALTTLLTAARAVIHCAAFKPKNDLATSEKINVAATQRLLDMSLRCHVKRMIYISSTSVYRATKTENGICSEDVQPVLSDKQNPYSLTKLKGEHVVQNSCRDSGLEYVILRPTNVYGAGSKSWDESTAATLRTWHIKFGRIPFDFVSVDDVAIAAVAAVSSSAKNEIFNIGNEMIDHSVFGGHIAKQRGIFAVRLPRAVDWTVRWSLRLIERVRGNIRSMDYSKPVFFPHDKARKLLGYAPRSLFEK